MGSSWQLGDSEVHSLTSSLPVRGFGKLHIIMLVSEGAYAYWIMPGKRWFLAIRNISLGMTCLERSFSGHSLVSERLRESPRHMLLLAHCARYPMPTILVTARAMAMTACMPSLPETVQFYGSQLTY